MNEINVTNEVLFKGFVKFGKFYLMTSAQYHEQTANFAWKASIQYLMSLLILN